MARHMSRPPLAPALRPRYRRALRASHRFIAPLLACSLALLGGGCATVRPGPITTRELAEAQTFPYYRVYWVGPRFGSYPLAAADGRKSYSSAVGDSVYYGDCLAGKSTALGSSGCQLPLQINTLIYVRHANAPLGAQRNAVLRGVPAVIYDGGHSIELYSGRLAIDVFSDSLAEALRGVRGLRPLNAPGSATGSLPLPVYCPGLSGPRSPRLRAILNHLPGHACQRAAAALAADRALFGKG
jgi:hypothetical protein